MCSGDIFLGLIAVLFPPVAGKLPTNHLSPLLSSLTFPSPPKPPSPLTIQTRPILNPFTAVWIKSGVCSADSFINIALCMLGYIPGLLHAWYIIAKNPEACDDDDDGYERLPGDGGENGRVTYFYVDPRAQPGQRLQQQQQQQQQQRGYGTTESMRASQQQLLQQPQEPQQGASGQWQVRGQPQGGSDGVPPSYEQAIRGDHKVQK